MSAVNRPEPYSAIVMAVLAAAFATWALLTVPLQGAVVLAAAGVLAWSGWIAFSYARPVRSRRVIAVYLLAVGFQLIHMAEEYTGGFPTRSSSCSTPRVTGRRTSSCSSSSSGSARSTSSPGPARSTRSASRTSSSGGTPSAPACSTGSRTSSSRSSRAATSPACTPPAGTSS
ncbi:hypothetical protein ACFQZ4_48455 [Catellatospora coxensis]